MFIWLNEQAVKRAKARKEKEIEGLFLDNIRVRTHEDSGKKYIDVSCYNPLDPTFVFPAISQDYIEKITFKARIDNNFRKEGIYRDNGAVLMLDSRIYAEHSSNGYESDYCAMVQFQEIYVSAPDMEKLKKIYGLVRQGKIEPAEDWTGKHETLSQIPASEQ